MRQIDILANFELEINQIDNLADKPSTEDSLFWLNQGVAKFVKQRFAGDPVHLASYEKNEKRRNDLIKLYKVKEYSDMKLNKSQPSYNQYTVLYPEDFCYTLNEDVIICDTDGDNKINTCVFECTQDSFMYRVTNSLTDFHYRYHKARPLRIRTDNGCLLLTDKNYNIDKYVLGYLRKPQEITLENPTKQYQDFEDIVMYEIIKIAAQMYLENKGDNRYQTITKEVITQE